MTTTRTLLATLLAATVASAAAGAPEALAASSKNCPKVKVGTLAANSMGRVWHKGATLYACTTVLGHEPRTKRMGRWTPGTQVAFTGSNLAWTTRLDRDGVRSNRLWAGNVDSGRRWMSGALAVPPTAGEAEAEDRVFKLVIADRAIAWSTYGGVVGMALEGPQSDPAEIGTLPAPLSVEGREKRLRVARYDDVDHVELASTLALEELPGQGDECGGVNPYRITFIDPTDPAEAQVGAMWDGSWSSTNCS